MISLILLGLAIGSTGGQVSTILYNRGNQVGTASFSSKLGDTGNLSLTLTVNSETQGRLVVNSIQAPNGRPTKLAANGGRNGQEASFTLIFGPKDVLVKVLANGHSDVKHLAYPKETLADLSNFWFIRDHPKVGAISSFSEFDIGTGTWKHKSIKYAGDEQTPGRKQRVMAHKLVSNEDIQWVDDKGLPYRIESKDGSGLVMVRD